MRRKMPKLIVPLLLLLLSGCATTELVALQPQCEPVVVPALPILEKGELWQALGDSQYRQLERYISGLWSVIDEQAAVIAAVCD